GIRDDLVTGVQTCALPISSRSGGGAAGAGIREGGRRAAGGRATPNRRDRGPIDGSGEGGSHSQRVGAPDAAARRSLAGRVRPSRSEERRVGKGVRAGGGRG